MTKNMSIYKKWSSEKCIYLISWTYITNYFTDYSDILFGLKIAWNQIYTVPVVGLQGLTL